MEKRKPLVDDVQFVVKKRGSDGTFSGAVSVNQLTTLDVEGIAFYIKVSPRLYRKYIWIASISIGVAIIQSISLLLMAFHFEGRSCVPATPVAPIGEQPQSIPPPPLSGLDKKK
jgi:hypothetical protein